MSYPKAMSALMKSSPVYDITVHCMTKPIAYREFKDRVWEFVDGHWSYPCCPKVSD